MHRLLRIVAPLIPLRHWQRWGRPPVLLPFYHLVSDENPSHVRHLYPVRSVRQFRDDLDFFLKNYRPVPLSALWDEAESRRAARAAKPPMHLSSGAQMLTLYCPRLTAHCRQRRTPFLALRNMARIFFVGKPLAGHSAAMQDGEGDLGFT
jgi:hypothetical protein